MNHRDWNYFITSEILGLENCFFINPEPMFLENSVKKGEKKSWLTKILESLKLGLQKRINPNPKNKEKYQRIPGELTGIESEVTYGENKSE